MPVAITLRGQRSWTTFSDRSMGLLRWCRDLGTPERVAAEMVRGVTGLGEGVFNEIVEIADWVRATERSNQQGLEVIALTLASIWLGVLSLAVLVIVRQVAILTVCARSAWAP